VVFFQTTPRRLYHKAPCPEGEMNYSKVVIKKTEQI